MGGACFSIRSITGIYRSIHNPAPVDFNVLDIIAYKPATDNRAAGNINTLIGFQVHRPNIMDSGPVVQQVIAAFAGEFDSMGFTNRCSALWTESLNSTVYCPALLTGKFNPVSADSCLNPA